MATTPEVSASQPVVGSRAAIPWPKVAWFAALIAICFAPVLTGMVTEWLEDEDMGHGVFVPVMAAWIFWRQRDRLQTIDMRPNRWGLVIVAWGACQLIAGTLGVEFFVARTAFIITLAGTILYLGGTSLLRAAAFPLFLLLFMVRIPAIIYNQITFPLQLFASSVAEQSLWAVGIPALREGNVLELPSQRLQVVEACSGIRSLLSLSFLSLIWAYMFDTKVWMRTALLVATVPIAVAANAFRVTMTGVLSEYNPELTKGFMHSAEGWVIFLISMVILAVVHQGINRGWNLYRRFRPGNA
jgi:exosortase